MVRRGSGPFMLVSSTDSTPVPFGLGCGELFLMESSQWFKSISERDRRRGDTGRVTASILFFCLLRWVLIHFPMEVEAALGLFGLVPRAGHGSSGPLASGEIGDIGPDNDESG